MEKVFEDYLSAIMTDMVDICMEYVDERADRVYIYCSYEEGAVFCDYYYRINGKMVQRNKLNDMLPPNSEFKYDTSGERQQAVNDILIDDMLQLAEVCKEYGRDIPTEIKMVYEATTGKFDSWLKYDPVFAGRMDALMLEVTDAWYEELEKRDIRM